MIKLILSDAGDRMQKSLMNTQSELSRIRTGRANLSMLDPIKVEYYGSKVPINQAANVGVPEPRLIMIQPWDKSMLGIIEKAILKADIGITPNNDGNVIRLPIPPLTEERRRDLVRLIHQIGEEGKVAMRNIRRDSMDQLKKAEKDSEISEDEQYNGNIDIQEITDEFCKKIDEIVDSKEKEMMEV